MPITTAFDPFGEERRQRLLYLLHLAPDLAGILDADIK
jgi:hypothetical protein